MSGLIVTEYVAPPIPLRDWDWLAYVEGADDEGDLGLTGYGPTSDAAYRDLAEKLALAYLEAV